MAIVNPDSSKPGNDTEGQTIITVDFDAGGDPDADNIDKDSGDTIMKIDNGLGTNKPTTDVHEVINKRTVAPASGINLDGTLDFGDGPTEVNTVWPDDKENTDPNGEYSYFHPRDIVSNDYQDLS